MAYVFLISIKDKLLQRIHKFPREKLIEQKKPLTFVKGFIHFEVDGTGQILNFLKDLTLLKAVLSDSCI